MALQHLYLHYMHVLMSFPHNDQNTPNQVPSLALLDDDPDNPSWSFPQEMALSSINNADGLDPSAFLEQEHVPLGDLSIHDEALPDDRWLSLQQRQERSNPADPNRVLGQWRDVNPASRDEPGSSSRTLARFRSLPDGKEAELPENHGAEDPEAKKHDHNAKERARRMKLNSSYLDLGTLLPDFQTSKKKWTAPGIVDRVVEYIPELQNEIENLNVRKAHMLSDERGVAETLEPDQESQAPTITIHEITRGEMVVQICAHRRDRDDAQIASLVRNIEAERICIINVSTVSVPDDRFYSYQIHIQVGESSVGAVHQYSTEAFRDKVISWLGS